MNCGLSEAMNTSAYSSEKCVSWAGAVLVVLLVSCLDRPDDDGDNIEDRLDLLELALPPPSLLPLSLRPVTLLDEMVANENDDVDESVAVLSLARLLLVGRCPCGCCCSSCCCLLIRLRCRLCDFSSLRTLLRSILLRDRSLSRA